MFLYLAWWQWELQRYKDYHLVWSACGEHWIDLQLGMHQSTEEYLEVISDNSFRGNTFSKLTLWMSLPVTFNTILTTGLLSSIGRERPRALLVLAAAFQLTSCWLLMQLFKKDFEASVSHRFISFEMQCQEAAARECARRYFLAT